MFRVDARVLVSVLAITMIAAAWGGRRLALEFPREGEADSTMQAAVFALLGLLLAFNFSMAGSRYDGQRKLIAEEANAIGTATLRSDMYPEPERAGFRADFREYLESRIADQEAGADVPRILAERARTAAAQRALWARASRLSLDPKNFVASAQMVPALTQMFDAAGRRFAAERARVPDLILYMLFAIAVIATFVAAFLGGRARRFDWFTAVVFVTIVSAVVYVTLELDRPRRGAIDVHEAEHALVEVRGLF